MAEKKKSGAKKSTAAAKKAVKTVKTVNTVSGKGGEHVKRAPRPVRRKVIPYLLILFALILGIFFVTVRLLGMDDGAGIIGYGVQRVFCGFFGGAAFLLPLVMIAVGINWCLYNVKWRGDVRNPSNSDYPDYRKARSRLISRTLLMCFILLSISAMFGVFADPSDLDVVELWNDGGDELISGGIVGGALGYLFVICFSGVVSVIILSLIIVVLALFLVGLTPDYIITKIQYDRALRREERERLRAEENEAMAGRLAEEADEAEADAVRHRNRIAAAAVANRQREISERETEEELPREEKPRGRKQNKANNMTADELMDEEYVPADEPPTEELPPEREVYIGPSEEELARTANKKRASEFIELEGDEPQNDSGETAETSAEPVDYAEEPAYDKDEFEGLDSLVMGMGNADNKADAEEDDTEDDTVADAAADTQTASAEQGSNVINIDELSSDGGKKEDVPQIDIGKIENEELLSEFSQVTPEEGAEPEPEEPEEIPMPYVFPPFDMLVENKNNVEDDYSEELQENAKALVDTLKSFKVGIREITYSRGPTITRYELKPEVGVRVRSIANLVDDIALSLATSGVRIEAPIPNKPAVGIEVPNRNRATVYLRDLIENSKFAEAKSRLTSCLGMDVGGNPIYFDIAKMPHLLIAGATGMGKSVCINSIIVSILYKAKPTDVKLILIDPKKVEFNIYKNIPHLYAPIVSEPKKAAGALASAVAEMERRFELIEEVGVRDISTYNAVTENDPTKEYMPQMVIIIDELADLMMTAPDEVESAICRLAQKARAAGIHIIIGTQRPSVDVITGLIKANIPSRIACTVASQIDSRTIIDIAGAEKLIGKGDMLFAPVGCAKPMRVQGAFVSEGEVENIVSFIRENNAKAKYNEDFINRIEEEAAKCGMSKKGGGGGGASADADIPESEGGDTKFRDAVKLAVEEGKISTSLMQRRLGVGYGRAAKIIDTMEQMGYVSKPDGNKPRRVLITMEEYMRRVVDGNLEGDSAGDGE